MAARVRRFAGVPARLHATQPQLAQREHVCPLAARHQSDVLSHRVPENCQPVKQHLPAPHLCECQLVLLDRGVLVRARVDVKRLWVFEYVVVSCLSRG